MPSIATRAATATKATATAETATKAAITAVAKTVTGNLAAKGATRATVTITELETTGAG